ncbi:endonuclease/exonuclease/phosphatase family protein [Vibrio sp. SM6]|uniref:Endonuclease/exonuclease/phosphatase family protein n=1 Tax=Vibrio agarilyticus TaxID=2726741 RepID=A0A7X8TT91_9VIBR|nr:endonuclease/exonuclease/phosphatase family protein [Vibrio agarilyticus]NLS14414.1 endonuclease/exonuclease/phosphatase family protein [Vibrio agarilyticus]
MKTKLLATLIASALLVGCNSNDAEQTPEQVKFASFNVSFAHDGGATADYDQSYDQWVQYMSYTLDQQNEFIAEWKENNNEGVNNGYPNENIAERIIQIRNIAAIIQKNRPDVLLLTEFNNDGTGSDYAALQGFQKNYLSVPQSLNSVDGGDLLEPIHYPFVQNYATNTGLHSEMDLNNDGKIEPSNPDDAMGFGFYHGHYAFALMSKYEIDTANTRTFQHFKRKDLPGAVNPEINVCDGSKEIPEGMACGDTWFSADEWNVIPMSSKNHVDAPIIIPNKDGNKVIHALLAHPTPMGFNTVSDNNKHRNSDENRFWHEYIKGGETIYDDAGTQGGFTGESFVIMGDLNADAEFGDATDARFDGVYELMNDSRVHQAVAHVGHEFTPESTGAVAENNDKGHPYPEARTAVFGSRVDYAVPSADLEVLNTGVYWQAENEEGRLLFNDSRIGKYGNSKEVSSDHRFVWSTVKVN